MFLGMENGVIRIQPLNSENPFLIGPYWSLTVHDNSYGKVSGLCSSFDDKYLFSVGTDGNFFMFEMMSEKKLEEVGLAKAKIPSARVEICISSQLIFKQSLIYMYTAILAQFLLQIAYAALNYSIRFLAIFTRTTDFVIWIYLLFNIP